MIKTLERESLDKTVSIIMPCRNGESTLPEAIESVLGQDYVDFELIIVDDGSTDKSKSIIEGYSKDPRVLYTENKLFGKGVWFARDIGLQKAVGRYIAFLDCDDYLLPGSLSARVYSLQSNGAKVVYGPYLRAYPDGDTRVRSVKPFVSFKMMLQKNHIGNLTGMYDSSVLGKIMQKNIPHEDYAMWLEIVKAAGYAISASDKPIAAYRVSSTSLSGNKFRALFWHWLILRKILHMNYIVSSMYFMLHIAHAMIDRISEKTLQVAPN